jgi:hypothetical protein
VEQKPLPKKKFFLTRRQLFFLVYLDVSDGSSYVADCFLSLELDSFDVGLDYFFLVYALAFPGLHSDSCLVKF